MKRLMFIPRWIVAGFIALTLILGGSAAIATSAFAAGEVMTMQRGNSIGTLAETPGGVQLSYTNTQTGTRTTISGTSNGGTKTVVKDANGKTLSTSCNGPDGKSAPCP